MEQTIIFATGNEGKMREIRAILQDLGIPVLSMKEAGVTLDITEDGTTFGENARIKAMAVWERTGGIVLADDSGLVVDYIGGEPGVYSARYMGENTSYEIKTAVLLSVLRGSAERSEAPVLPAILRLCCLTAALFRQRSIWKGLIAEEPAGKGALATILFYICLSLGRHPQS